MAARAAALAIIENKVALMVDNLEILTNLANSKKVDRQVYEAINGAIETDFVAMRNQVLALCLLDRNRDRLSPAQLQLLRTTVARFEKAALHAIADDRLETDRDPAVLVRWIELVNHCPPPPPLPHPPPA